MSDDLSDDGLRLPSIAPPSGAVRGGLERLIAQNEGGDLARADAGELVSPFDETSAPDGSATSGVAASSSDLAPGRLVGDKWILEQEVGRGGFGTVWAARHSQLAQRRAAVKVLLGKHASEKSVRLRFKQEAVAMISIRSDHVVHVYDYGVLPDDTPYLAMEFLDGESLAKRMERGRLVPEEIARVADEICQGLSAIHRAEIVHRDLNPANIFLCAGDARRVKILDFGIAKTAEDLTGTHMVMGALPYIPPEGYQVGGGEADARADLHTVAVVLYEAITGKRAFRGESPKDFATSIPVQMPEPVYESRPEVPRAVHKVLLKAMAKQPEQRQRDVEVFRAEFAAAMAVWLDQSAPAPLSVEFRRRAELGPARPGELVIMETSAGRATAALKKGLASVTSGGGSPMAIVAASEPTLDDMLAIEFLRLHAAGARLPAGAHAFSVYAATARMGLEPADARLERSLLGIYLALRASVQDLTNPAQADRFLESWAGLYAVVKPAMDANDAPTKEGLFNHHDLQTWHAFLREDAATYTDRDLKSAKRWSIRLPNAAGHSGKKDSALVLHTPRSLLFKHWARRDKSAPTGNYYTLLAVRFEPDTWIISTNPAHRIDLTELCNLLQEREPKVDGRVPLWYDGRRHDRTLIQSPDDGTRLTVAEVESIIREWTHAEDTDPPSAVLMKALPTEAVPARSSRVIWAALLTLLCAAAAALWFVMRDANAGADGEDPPRAGAAPVAKVQSEESSVSAVRDEATGAKGRPLTVQETQAELAAPTGPASLRRFGLVVGVCDYPADRALNSPCRDARDFRQLLIDHYAYAPEDIDMMVDRDATGGAGQLPTARNLKKAVETFAARHAMDEASAFILFYSGHGGFQSGAQQDFGLLQPSGYFTSAKDEPDDVKGWEMKRILDDLQKYIPSRHIMVVLDNCYAGWGGEKGSAALDDALRSYWSSPTRVVLTAASRGQQAWEDEPLERDWAWGGHSALTAFLIEGLTPVDGVGPPANQNGDGLVTSEELFRAVERRVGQAVKAAKEQAQTPQYFPRDEQFPKRGQFVFVPSASSGKLPAPPRKRP